MSKYSDEFKLEVIKYCIEGYSSTAKYFNIPSSETVRRWCKHYKMHGIKGITKYKNNKYDGKFKQKVVEYIDYYNNRKIKGKLKGMSPVQYRVHSQVA